MKGTQIDDEMGEDWCFSCKDGGDLRICDFMNCRKAYHHDCVGKDKSFLDEAANNWECPWHSCATCKEEAVFQCYCCPSSSFCHTCVKEVEFALVRNSNKGFCRMCLRLAILTEKITDYDEIVEYDEQSKHEHFRDYWYFIKKNESLSFSDLKAAKRRVKQTGGENGGMSEEDYERETEPEADSETLFSPEECRKQKSKAKSKLNSLLNKKYRSKTRNFIEWGSEELIGFLVSIGRGTDKPMSQGDAERVVKEYIEMKNLYQTGKKKRFVLCDEPLIALFGKRRVKFNRIYKMLEEHFPGSQGDIISLPESDEEEDYVAVKKRKVNGGGPSHMWDVSVNYREKISEEKKRCTATLDRDNIKIIYLRRTLVLQLLKYPDKFEQKMMGCFVRVKHDPKEFFGTPPNLYQIGQVTGVGKSTEMYQVQDMSTDVVIRVSNIHKDIKLSSLADDDFSDEDVSDLRKLVQKGLYKMPTVGEVAEKLELVHEDITRHWIEKELARLPKLIQRANEKGWRREMFDYIARSDLLRNPEEQERLKKEMPLILADPEEMEEKEEKVVAKAEACHCKPVLEVNDDGEVPMEEVDCNERTEINMAITNGHGRSQELAEVESPNSLKPDSSRSNHVQEDPNNCFETPKHQPVEPNKDAKPNNATQVTQPVVDISDSDSDSDNKAFQEDSGAPKMPAKDECAWCYLDPQGMVQGPFTMTKLRLWEQGGYFDQDFKVWHVRQSRQNAILLSEASRNTV